MSRVPKSTDRWDVEQCPAGDYGTLHDPRAVSMEPPRPQADNIEVIVRCRACGAEGVANLTLNHRDIVGSSEP